MSEKLEPGAADRMRGDIAVRFAILRRDLTNIRAVGDLPNWQWSEGLKRLHEAEMWFKDAVDARETSQPRGL